MAIRGQRFHINLSSDEETDDPRPILPTSPSIGLVGDIKERSLTSDSKPPSPPRIKKSDAHTGFPAHRKRERQSASTFKRTRVAQSSNGHEGSSPGVNVPKFPGIGAGNHGGAQKGAKPNSQSKKEDESQSIDAENKRRIAEMSSEEIEEARTELLTGLSSSLIERLLKNANIDDDAVKLVDTREPGWVAEEFSHAESRFQTIASNIPDEKDSTPFKISSAAEPPSLTPSDLPPSKPPPDLRPASVIPPRQKPDAALPPPPSLDPSSPSFLSDLHATYFPSLPANPSAMAWMAPLPPPSESEYSPSLATLPPSSLRFDFRGHLLPPRLAAQIPATKGLHHHSLAPDAAGYTIPELARLARSAVAAQRCIAYQTLGRFLYRLGRGDFGQEGDDLCESLWAMIADGEVLDLLIREAARGQEGGNRTCWVIATEAVWLWRKGGGKRWKAE